MSGFTIQGRWKTSTGSAGGSLDYPTWRNNPQFLLEITQPEVKVKISIEVVASSERAKNTHSKGVGLYAFRHPTDTSLPLISTTDGDKALFIQASGLKGRTLETLSFTATNQESPYYIIPCFDHNRSGEFSLTTSHGKFEMIPPYRCLRISGAWKKTTSGGPKSSSRFGRNPNFFINIIQNTQVHVSLSRSSENSLTSSLGFYIVKTDEPKPVSKISSKAKVHESQFITVPEGTYAIIPCTDPAIQCDFTLIVYSKEKIDQLESLKVKTLGPDSSGKRRRVNRSKSISEDKNSKSKFTRDEAKKKVDDMTSEEILDTKKKLEKARAQLEKMKKEYEHDKQEWEKEKHFSEESDRKIQLKLQEEKNTLVKEIEDIKKRKAERERKIFQELQDLKSALLRFQKAEDEAEDHIDWKRNISSDKMNGKGVEIMGEWKKGSTAGGSLNHLSWRHNPQIFVQTHNRNTKLNISLFQPKSEKMLSISLYVFRTYSEHPKRLVMKYKEEDIVSEGYFSNLNPSKVTVEATLQASKFPYVIIPVTFLPNDESKFMLSIKSNQDITAWLSGPKDEWPCTRGNWDAETAGGCTNFLTFVHNPQYIFSITKGGKVSLHLIQEENQDFDTLSVFILKANDDMKYKFIRYTSALEIDHCNFDSRHEASLMVDLSPGSYVVIPCTFNPGKIGSFQLRALSPVDVGDINLKLLPPIPMITINSDWNAATAGGCLNNPEKWKLNRQYLLDIKKKVSLTIVLTQLRDESQTAFGIGYIIATGGEKITNPSTARIIYQSTYKPVRRLVETLSLDPGTKPYVIVPSTFEPGQQCRYSIQITSDEDDFQKFISLTMI